MYPAVVVVLMSALRSGLTSSRLRWLQEKLSIDRRTLERWRKWWRETFPRTSFWKNAKARFLPPLDPNFLPRSCESHHEIWARFRFSVVGPLLSAPPESGGLKAVFQELSRRTWRHPLHEGQTIRFGLSTIERWYYIAKASQDPIEDLRRSVRKDAGCCRLISDRLAELIRSQYREYSYWTYRLHHDNFTVLVEKDQQLGSLPSYQCLVRYMKAKGMKRTKRTRNEKRAGMARARDRL